MNESGETYRSLFNNLKEPEAWGRSGCVPPMPPRAQEGLLEGLASPVGFTDS